MLLRNNHLGTWQGIYNYKFGDVFFIKLRSFWEETIFAIEVKGIRSGEVSFDYKIVSLDQAILGHCGAP